MTEEGVTKKPGVVKGILKGFVFILRWLLISVKLDCRQVDETVQRRDWLAL